MTKGGRLESAINVKHGKPLVRFKTTSRGTRKLLWMQVAIEAARKPLCTIFSTYVREYKALRDAAIGSPTYLFGLLILSIQASSSSSVSNTAIHRQTYPVQMSFAIIVVSHPMHSTSWTSRC
jgi:hypothetical protein